MTGRMYLNVLVARIRRDASCVLPAGYGCCWTVSDSPRPVQGAATAGTYRERGGGEGDGLPMAGEAGCWGSLSKASARPQQGLSLLPLGRPSTEHRIFRSRGVRFGLRTRGATRRRSLREVGGTIERVRCGWRGGGGGFQCTDYSDVDASPLTRDDKALTSVRGKDVQSLCRQLKSRRACSPRFRQPCESRRERGSPLAAGTVPIPSQSWGVRV